MTLYMGAKGAPKEPHSNAPRVTPSNSSRPAFQSSIKSVKCFVIDAQGVVETSQSTCHAQFFAGYPYKVVLEASLAFFEDFTFRSQITFFNEN